MMDNQEEFESTGDETLDAYIQLNEQDEEEPVSSSTLDIEEPDYSYLDDIEYDEDENLINQYYGPAAVREYRAVPLKQIDQKKAKAYYDYIYGQTNSPQLAASLVGNLMKESGGNPKAVHDNDTGYGLFGHRLDRRTYLLNEIKNSSKPEDYAQIDAALKELKTKYAGTYNKILKAPNVDLATEILMNEWERPNPKYADLNARKMYARSVQKQVGGYAQGGLYSSLANGIPYSNYENSLINRPQFNQQVHSAFLENGAPIQEVSDVASGGIPYKAIDDAIGSGIDKIAKGIEVVDEIKGTAGQLVSGALTGAETMLTKRNNFLESYKLRKQLLEESKEDYDSLEGQNKQKEIWT